MDKAPIYHRLGRWYADFRRSPKFPKALWIFTGVCLALVPFGLSWVFPFFMGALSVEASLAGAYLSQDSKETADRMEKMLSRIEEIGRHQIDMSRHQINMTRHQLSLSQAILEATRAQ